MKGKDKGIYWAKVLPGKTYETERCIYPAGFVMALGDKKTYEKLLKDKVVSAAKIPADVTRLKNPKKKFKPIKTI